MISLKRLSLSLAISQALSARYCCFKKIPNAPRLHNAPNRSPLSASIVPSNGISTQIHCAPSTRVLPKEDASHIPIHVLFHLILVRGAQHQVLITINPSWHYCRGQGPLLLRSLSSLGRDRTLVLGHKAGGQGDLPCNVCNQAGNISGRESDALRVFTTMSWCAQSLYTLGRVIYKRRLTARIKRRCMFGSYLFPSILRVYFWPPISHRLLTTSTRTFTHHRKYKEHS